MSERKQSIQVETGVQHILGAPANRVAGPIDEKSMTKEQSNASGRHYEEPIHGARQKEWDSKSPIAHQQEIDEPFMQANSNIEQQKKMLEERL